MGPPLTEPFSWVRRYFTARVHSANLVLIPRSPAMISQSVAPGPPREIATATPAMFPMPTVPDTAVASAWKGVTSPGWEGSV